MIDLDEALARVRGGADAVVQGTPVALRAFAQALAADLGDGAAVVSVQSPLGLLNLSHLIAQLAGTPDFDTQDDAVLEAGFRRLMAAPGRTVLVVQAPQGIGASALRYLQHLARSAPRLTLVVAGGAGLAAQLSDPAFAALRARLGGPAPAPEPQPEAQVAPEPPPVVARRRRGPIVWTASAIGLAAAVVIGLWFGYGAGVAQNSLLRGTKGVTLEKAVVSPAPLVTGDAAGLGRGSGAEPGHPAGRVAAAGPSGGAAWAERATGRYAAGLAVAAL